VTRRQKWQLVGAAALAGALVGVLVALGVILGASGWTMGWVLLVAWFAVLEALAIRQDWGRPGDPDGNGVADTGATLSEHLRRWFRLDTRLGRSVYLVTAGGFALWFFVPHLLLGIA
jgi:hypothetical protein